MLRRLLEPAFPDPQCLGAYPSSLRRRSSRIRAAGDLARICRPLDWFGLNHYSPHLRKGDAGARLGFGFGEKPAGIAADADRLADHPEAFRDTLLTVARRYGLPIYVLENGFGGRDAAGRDRRRDRQ